MSWRVILLLTLFLTACVPAQPPTVAVPQPDTAVAAPAPSPLSVTAVVPEPSSSAVPFNAAVFVQFNRPVVPLTTLAHAPAESPLQIAPPVAGSGHWINTGLYTFTPDVAWAPSTTYHVVIPRTSYAWSFSTLPPAVASTEPARSATLVDPAAPVRVTFNQPVDAASAELEVTPAVNGRSEWPDNRTLIFRPDAGLTAGATYQAEVKLEGLAARYAWRFDTAPQPSVTSSVPQDGAEAPKRGQVELRFSAPMDRDDVRANLSVQPQLDHSPYPQWSDDDTHATITGAFKPQTHYTLALSAGTRDRFGRSIRDAYTLRFQTPASESSPSAPPVTPQAWLVSPGLVGTFDAYAHPAALLRTTNVSHFDYRVDAVDEGAAVQLYSGGFPERIPDGRRVMNGGLDVEFERNVPRLTTIDLGQLGPGYYRLRIEPKERDAKVQDHLVVVTHTMLAVKESTDQMLVWARDLKTGKPLSNLPVRLLRASSPGPVAQGTTDANGIAQLGLRPAGPRIQTLAVVDRPGDASLALSVWSGGVGPWSFGLAVNYPPTPSSQFTAHVYTDRPIYQPGQTVHLKGIVRADDDARYSLPPESFTATWQARDSQGRIFTSGSVGRLSEFGTFPIDLELSQEAVTGAYSFNLQRAGDQVLASTSFLVAEYQRPDFEVSLNTPRQVVAGQSLNASLRAAYYFGQPVADADVHWQISAEPFTFTWPADPSFRFGDTDQRALKPVSAPTHASRAEGKTRTTADGSAAFQVPTTLAQDETSQRFTVEATVTDPDHRDVSNRSSTIVHKAELYLGLKPTTFVARARDRLAVELVTLDVQGQPRASVAAHAQVLRRRWMSVRERDAQGELHWISRPDDTPVSELDVLSGVDGRGSLSFTPAEGGEYRLMAEAPDSAGNVARTAITVWVAGPGFIPWRINDDGRLELQADKPLYQPGDVAHVIVPAPVADAAALITVERGKLISHSARQLSGNSAVLDVPIGVEHIPNAYVSVVLFGGGQSPALWTGYVQLSVSSAERQLEVTAEADRREHGPGDSVTYTIRTRDSRGEGVRAEVSLGLVDAAVLALTDSHADPVMAFWHKRPVGVRGGSSLGASIDRLNEAVSSGLKGGGGGDAASVRQDFPDTAFWAPAVHTGAGGVARVEVHLPDTLTTWRMTAVAVTQDTRLGVASSDVVTSKPLLVRPLAPRFLVGGDVATVGAAVHNTTSQPLSIRASLRSDGLRIDGDTQRSIELSPGAQVHVEWPVTSPPGSASDAMLHFVASSSDGAFRDAVDVRVPLLTWGASTTTATAGEVAPAQTITETVDLSKEIDQRRGELTVEVAPSLAAALRYSLRQVEEYPYECLEQTVSRFLPRLVLQRAIDRLGLSDPLNLRADLPGLVTRSIQRVYRFQHADGGWGWWSGDSSQPYLSAYALFGLLEARRDGFTVDQDVITRGATYLRQWLNADPGVFGLETRAYVVYVLGLAGTPDPSRAATLFDRRADLGPVGKAYLAQTLSTIDRTDTRIGGLLAELSSAAVVSATGSHWEESNQSLKAWIMASDVRTTAAVLDALVRLRPDHPLVQSSVRWLMAARRDEHGYWASTHDTSQSLLTLTDYLSASGELQGNFEWQLGVNAQTRQSGTVNHTTVSGEPTRVVVPMPQLMIGQNQVDLIRSVGPGRLYYTLQLRSFAQSEDIPFVSQGFTLGREYLSFSGGPVGEVHVGDLVQVRLTLIAPAALQDLVLEDPLPAGLEPVDTPLKTTSQAVADVVRGAQTPGWQPWTHLDLRTDRVALFATYVGRGAYRYTYVARASLPGVYHVLPTSGHEQYFPDVFARGDGQHLTILP